jgi:Uma2 family endonuclease
MATAHSDQTDEVRQRLDELARRAKDPTDPTTMSYEEFLEWADEDTLAEWVDGKIEMSSPASLRHQLLKSFLARVFSTYVDVFALGLVLDAPFQMKLPFSGREPDILFLAGEHLDRLRDARIEGAADLVVEIVSPESITRDRETKLEEYRRGGVPEYWIIDPMSNRADFHQLDAHGRYVAVPADADGIYRSRALPGFWLDVAWFWQDPLPDVISTLYAIAGEPFLRYIAARTRSEQ